ncbi:hypothetical protein ACHAWO_013765 [Cyclotella atomus]|uniref:Uncharacterized protein n=1 Tax=Cyclotella atomus TaxID=382360 RepID=A0ABD3NTC9_9STRA
MLRRELLLSQNNEEEPRRYPRQNTVGNWKDGPRKDNVLKEHKGKWKMGMMCLLTLPAFALSVVRDWGQPPPGVTNISAKGSFNLFGTKSFQAASLQLGRSARRLVKFSGLYS